MLCLLHQHLWGVIRGDEVLQGTKKATTTMGPGNVLGPFLSLSVNRGEAGDKRRICKKRARKISSVPSNVFLLLMVFWGELCKKTRYREDLGARKSIQLVFVSTFGLKRGLYGDAFSKAITIDDLFTKHNWAENDENTKNRSFIYALIEHKRLTLYPHCAPDVKKSR